MVIIAILVKRLVKILKSESAPKQIALGFVLGMFLGLVSFKTLFALPVIILVILLKVNLASVLFSLLLFKLIGYLLDPIIHRIGYFLLVEVHYFQPLWIRLYTVKIVPYTRFYNTIVMGSLILSILLAVPVYMGIKKLIEAYNLGLREKIKKWKIVKFLSATRFAKWLTGIKNIGV